MRNRIFVAFVVLAVCSIVVASSVLVVNAQTPNGASGQTVLVTYERDKLLRLSELLQSQMQNLRRRLDDDHPDVIAIRRRLQGVEKALRPVNSAWLLSKDVDTVDETDLREAVKILARQVAHLNARVSQLEEAQEFRIIPARSP